MKHMHKQKHGATSEEKQMKHFWYMYGWKFVWTILSIHNLHLYDQICHKRFWFSLKSLWIRLNYFMRFWIVLLKYYLLLLSSSIFFSIFYLHFFYLSQRHKWWLICFNVEEQNAWIIHITASILLFIFHSNSLKSLFLRYIGGTFGSDDRGFHKIFLVYCTWVQKENVLFKTHLLYWMKLGVST